MKIPPSYDPPEQKMSLLRLLLLVLISSICAMPAVAEPRVAAGTSVQAERRVLEELYGGVVANQTITVAGQDFYQHFVAAWRDFALSERFAISVHERPSARWGTQIWIEYAQRRVFQASLPTGRAGIKSLSEQAAEFAYQKVTDVEVERLLFRDTDIGADEI
jgi:curli production assembly/transport component CsgE